MTELLQSPLIPILFGLGIFYFLVIRPANQEREAKEQLLTSLAKDDKVVTTAGLWGTVVSVSDNTLELQIADKTRVTIDKSSVARRQGEPEKPAS
ncbi:MAG: preprotein translocase subunit YajC [Myxococcota bacterium]